MATRITSSMLASNFMTNSNRNLVNMQKLQNQLSSGKEINRPSDNPYKVSRTMQLYSEIDANKQYNENIKDISNWLNTTDTSIGQMENVFSRIRELMVSAGNGAYGTDEKKAIQDEIKELKNQLAQILNTNFDGAYIFGGTKSTSKPIMIDENGKLHYADKDGNAMDFKNLELFQDPIKIQNRIDKNIDEIADLGNKITGVNDEINDLNNTLAGLDPNDEKRKEIEEKIKSKENEKDKLEKDKKNLEEENKFLNDPDKIKEEVNRLNQLKQIESSLNVEISQGVFVDYNINATDLLQFTDSKTGEIIDVMDVLDDIISNLGEDGDISKITGENLGQIDSIISNVLQKRSQVGAMTNRMEAAESKNEDENINMKDILSKTEDIDFAEKMIEYSIMQTVYTAALQVSAKILPTTILDYIR